jgi:protein O-mannosyl-transferase
VRLFKLKSSINLMKSSGLCTDLRSRAHWILILLSAVIAVAAYLQALHYPFISDDVGYVAENFKLANLSFTELWQLFTEPYSPQFEFLPLRELSYWVDITLFGLDPAAFRLHNILLYLLCLPLVYGTTLALWHHFRPSEKESAAWAAAAITALFALHPALVESVVWISGRKYILPDLFSLLALWCAVKAKREIGLSTPYVIATLIAFVAVMLSKSSYVGIAPTIALLWVLFWMSAPTRKWRSFPALEVAAIMLIAIVLLRTFIAKNNGFDSVSFYFGMEAVTRLLAVLGGLVRLVYTPENRHFLYPVFEDPWFPYLVVLGGAALAIVASGAVILLRRRTLEGFALVTFFLLCMPYLQLVPAKPPALVSDRYLALAVWPAMLLVVALAWRLKVLPRTVLLLAIATIWSYQTIERPRDWQNFKTLIQADFSAFPGYSIPAMYKVGIELSEKQYLEAIDTANGITIPEARNTMTKLVIAHQALVDSATTRNPSHAMDIFSNYSRDLKTLPAEAQWNTPLIFMWHKNRVYLGQEWRNLSKIFPNDALVRNNANKALSEPWRDVFAKPANAPL